MFWSWGTLGCLGLALGIWIQRQGSLCSQGPWVFWSEDLSGLGGSGNSEDPGGSGNSEAGNAWGGCGKFALNFAFDLASRCASTLTALLYFLPRVCILPPPTSLFPITKRVVLFVGFILTTIHLVITFCANAFDESITAPDR